MPCINFAIPSEIPYAIKHKIVQTYKKINKRETGSK